MTSTETISGPEDGKKKFSPAQMWHSASLYQRSFLEGLGAGAIVFALLIGWMALRSDRTAETVQPLIAVKSAEIEMGAPVVVVQDEKSPDAAGADDAPKAAIVQADGLSEQKDGFTLPIIRSSDDMTVFQTYKRPFVRADNKAQVAIVVVDFGLSESLSDAALKTPEGVTLALTPYADNPAQWGEKAREAGRELWLSLPMQVESAGSDDTGPLTIRMNTPIEENQKRLFTVLSSASGYVGLLSQQGHNVSADDLAVRPIIQQIFGRGLGFAESNPGGAGFGESYARETGAPYARNNVWLDADLRPENIDRALQVLEMNATKNGKAVAFVHPYPVVLQKLSTWMGQADSKGLQIAPLSAMVQ